MLEHLLLLRYPCVQGAIPANTRLRAYKKERRMAHRVTRSMPQRTAPMHVINAMHRR
jgi:hypothetical protein